MCTNIICGKTKDFFKNQQKYMTDPKTGLHSSATPDNVKSEAQA